MALCALWLITFWCVAEQKLAQLRAEADANADRADAAEAKVKQLEQLLLTKDQDIGSLNHKLGVLDADLEKSEARLAAAKLESADSTSTKSTAENLARKIQLLEDELDTAEKNVKETMEKYVVSITVMNKIYSFGYNRYQIATSRCQGRTL